MKIRQSWLYINLSSGRIWHIMYKTDIVQLVKKTQTKAIEIGAWFSNECGVVFYFFKRMIKMGT